MLTAFSRRYRLAAPNSPASASPPTARASARRVAGPRPTDCRAPGGRCSAVEALEDRTLLAAFYLSPSGSNLAAGTRWWWPRRRPSSGRSAGRRSAP